MQIKNFQWLSRGSPGVVPDPSQISGTITVYVNGHVASTPTPVNLLTSRNLEIQIGTGFLRFPLRGQNGNRPDPAKNFITLVYSPPFNLALNKDVYTTLAVAAQLGTLTIKALSPIVLVHGIRAGSGWFPDNHFTDGWTDPSGGHSLHIPFVAAIDPATIGTTNNLNPGSIEDTGRTLNSVIRAIANSFGVSKVHIVAHSKGGLWSRYFLNSLNPGSPYSRNVSTDATAQNFGVLSLITLDTPHMGSIMADIMGQLDTVQRLAAPLLPPRTVFLGDIEYRQIQDLSRAYMRDWNAAHVEPGFFKDTDNRIYPTVYRSISADADINNKVLFGFRYVDAGDAAEFDGGVPVATLSYHLLGGERVYLAAPPLGAIQGLLATGVPPTSFSLNDLVVTQSSSTFSYPFVLLYDPVRRNHASVGDACIGAGLTTSCDLLSSPTTPAGAGVANLNGGVLGAIHRIQPVP